MMSESELYQHAPQPTSLASLQTVAQARAQLEARLVGIHNDLQLTQTIGLLFVKRQEDLKSCFDQLQELKNLESPTHRQHHGSDNDSASGSESLAQQPLPESLREQLALIDKEFQEGQNGILGLKGLIDAQLPTIEVQPPQNDGMARSGSSVLGPSALPSSALPAQTISKPRRHKVVVPSTPSINDAAFPVQIQEELLNQVRYWTSQAEMKEKLNQEYDTKITEQERIIDALNKQRRMREESDERLKEDQWNLELMNQELRAQNTDLQAQLSRAQHETTKVQKALTVASEQVEQLKDKEERTAGQLELTKSRHEQDMVTMRKHTAGIQREKSDLLKKMEDLNATVAQQQQKLAKKATLEAIAAAQDREDLEPESPVEAPILIQAPPRLPNNDEVAPAPVASAANEPKTASLARETSFAHQQSIISELQAKLSKEISEKEQLISAKEELLGEKEELAKMLADREETIETLRVEGTMAVVDTSPVVNEAIFCQPSLRSAGHVSDHSEADTLGSIEEIHASSKEDPLSQGLPPMRPVSPKHLGGLFAELAQAKSSTEEAMTVLEVQPTEEAMPVLDAQPTVEAPSVLEVKPVVEYRDQEVMTEPIESWIHTIPGFAPAASVAAIAAVAAATSSASPVATENAEIATGAIATSTDPSTAVDGTTNTDIMSLVDHATNTEIKSSADSATNTEIKSSVDSATNTETKGSTDHATNTDSVTIVDHATSTTDDLPAFVQHSEKRKSVATRNGHLSDIVTGKPGEENALSSGTDSPSIATPTVAGLEVASVRIPEILDEVQDVAQVKAAEPAFVEPHAVSESMHPDEAKVLKDLELETSEPVPRFMHSDIPLDDERRHTCDMSQSIPESPSQAVPPVPALPKGLVQTRPLTIASPEAHDFRVSFGSAFGDADGTSMATGRIEPFYGEDGNVVAVASDHRILNTSQENGHHEQEDQENSAAEALSPGRPSVGPPTTLLARAAARASMAPDLDALSLNEAATSSQQAEKTNGARETNSSTLHNRAYSGHSLGFQGAAPIAYPPRTASIRSEKRYVSSSPPQSSHTRPPMPTGAAVISSTTRTAYTFSSSSSQVHIPQSQQPQYQHITDSSGASIGRHRDYRPSPNGSISSMSTDYGGANNGRRLSIGSNYDGNNTATDPTMIQVITQTMIGDYLWKYTRRPMASVISEKRHKRYFWVHPYTKTMYWSLNNPAADGSREQRAKSALIVAVFQITDENASSNSDLPNVSLLVQTSSRNLKLTAPTRQKHELWYQSLAYLLSRPTTPGADIPSDNQTWSEVQATRGVTSDTLLTIRNDKTVRKKGSFNRLQNMFGRSRENSPGASPKGYSGSGPASASGMALNSGVSSALQQIPGGAGSGVTSVLGYPSHMVSAQGAVGGFGTMNGGPIMTRQATSSLGTNNSTSPRSKLNHHQHGYEDDYHQHAGTEGEYDDGDLDDDDDDGELPEHVRQCCDGKHDIGSLHHHR
ncbi:hypothetical protein KVV02_000095 [Mortierella alpina]|uniref:PH domain-containing protein n=1 Tax=Mortierella alpina TaxID=64518 RepID=A0A9P8CUQ0_MORAP|nr:hypothetical protein KVV02_000095 [Mortierella alpina]